MKVAAGGRSGGADPGNDLAHPHRVPLLDGDGLKVVVRGDQPVAVVNFHAVPAAPRVPADGPHHTGVGGVDPSAAGRRVVLAQVELSYGPGNRTDAEPEGRTRRERFKRRHEGAFRRALELRGSHIQRCTSALGHRPDDCAAERDKGPAVRGDSTGQPGQAAMYRAQPLAKLPGGVQRGRMAQGRRWR